MFQDENHITYDKITDSDTSANMKRSRSNLMLSLFLLILAVFILIFSFAIIDKAKYSRTQQIFKREEILASKTARRYYLDDGLYKKDPILPIIFHTDDNDFQFVKYHNISSGDKYIMNIPTNDIFKSSINITKFTSVFLDHLSLEINANPKHWQITFFGYTADDKKGGLYNRNLYIRLSTLSRYLTKRNIADEEVSIGILPLSIHPKKKGYISVSLTELDYDEGNKNSHG